ncbi:MAG: PAS domain S-box protein [Deltaproteobacteria bacterium]|nr:PAS domain S-box protein [Deltaproteobacteria bacterium]
MLRWRSLWPERPILALDERRRRRREAAVIVVTALVVLVLALFETRLPQFSNSSSLSGNIIFFLLINLNLILLILLVFLVTRNLVKLLFERRQRILGSRLRTRLVLAFVSLTLFPTLLLFLVAQGFLNTAIENWFSVRVESSLAGSLDVAQSYYQATGNDSVHFARVLGEQVAQRGLWGSSRRAALREFLAEKLRELNLSSIEVFDAGREAVVSVAQTEPAGATVPAAPSDMLDELLGGQASTGTQRVSKGDLVRGGMPLTGADGKIIGALVVGEVVPRHVSRTAQDISRSYQEYRQLKTMKQPIKNGYILTLFLITLVVIFSATWFGFYLAKGITVPIQRVAEGTRELARGNWDFRIASGGDEEIATLVDSFNRMTAELKTIHSELDERRRYIENILANVTAGVIAIADSGIVTTVNRAVTGMVGLRAPEVIGGSWREVFARSDLRKVGELVGQVIDGGESEAERQLKFSGGERVVTALVTATTLRDDAGAPLGWMVFFEDVSHLLRVERMEAWREVARRIAHEIKNPLTPIQLSAQRLRKRYSSQLDRQDDAVFDECTRTIIRQVEELKKMVNEFSTFARMPAAELSAQNLNEVVEEALVLFREGHREIDFDWAPAAELPALELDREAIKRAVVNLLDNAVAACAAVPGERGRIAIATGFEARAGLVRLELADSGTGISAAVKHRIFEPYFSTKKDGTGLGLAIVSAIVADHQAYIRVRDNAPHGSKFIIEFPLRRRLPLARVGGARI